MPFILPAAIPISNIDQGTDDPKAWRNDGHALISRFNTLLTMLGGFGIKVPGDGLETIAQASGVADLVRVKLDPAFAPASLINTGAGIKVNAAGIRPWHLFGSGLTEGNSPVASRVYGTNESGVMGFHPAASLTKKLRMQAFTTSGTFTVPSAVDTVIAIMQGGGGGGGGGNGSTHAGGGGGAGGTVFANPTTLVAGQNIAVTVGSGGTGASGNANGGNGGTSTFGSGFGTAGGGGGGGSGGSLGPPGNGGAASGGLLNVNGQVGGNGGTSYPAGGFGGHSILGFGGHSLGFLAQGFGGGGAGYITGAVAHGAPGIVLVLWVA
jgi:hypothetical protein